VDVGCEKQVSRAEPYASRGTPSLPSMEKSPEGIFTRFWAALVVFFVTLFTLVHSKAFQVTKRLPDTVPDNSCNIPDLTVQSNPKEDYRPPSPAPGFTEAELLSSALKKLGELEEKVDMLQAKPFEMPYEKAELLNAAVCRVDALEAELIATKKALHEALMRQEELLAYIDRQEEAKLRKKKFLCW